MGSRVYGNDFHLFYRGILFFSMIGTFIFKMRYLLALTAALCTLSFPLDHRDLVGPNAVDAPVDCAMRSLQLEWALFLLPERAPLLDVFDALRLDIDCNVTRPTALTSEPKHPYYTAPASRGGGSGALSLLRTLAPAAGAIYADPVGGSDATGTGSVSSPFRTIERALAASRSAGGGGAIVLRAGTFFLPAPIVLSYPDSGLTISAYPREAPVLSGGAALPTLAWSSLGPVPGVTQNATIWVADLSAAANISIPFASLFSPSAGGSAGGASSWRRAVRARFPNADPERDLVPDGYTLAKTWLPPRVPKTPVVQSRPLLGTRTPAACPADACTADGPHGFGPPWAIFCCFFWGTGGTVENLTTGSFWGTSPGPPGGDTFSSPGGMIAGADVAARLSSWASPRDAVVHAITGAMWGNFMWSDLSVNTTEGSIAFGAGGAQARNGGGGDYYFIENLREELDAPGEWFVDPSSKQLFYVANGTAPPPADGWIASQVDNIITLAGTPAAPVSNVTLAGLTFAHTAPTFLSPFTSPSGGDWMFQDGGAVRLSGSFNASIFGSLFVNLGSTGVMLSGFNRRASIVDNEFLAVGECAVISAGLSGDTYDNSLSSSAYGEGLLLSRNLAHEVGQTIKQAGFYYHAMTANATVTGNVFFNGPRAGINVNDAAFGGHLFERNLAFNFVRCASSWARRATVVEANPPPPAPAPQRDK
jgi:hypothetical protein